MALSISYSSIVPWGRSYDEYVAMFALSEKDLNGTILGCGDGPADFNSVLTARGGHVISIDPIYQFCSEEIKQRIDETCESVVEQTKQNVDKFLWTKFENVEDLVRVRLRAMGNCLYDFNKGKEEGRYIAGELPTLPPFNFHFDLALSSHFLFLYSDNLTYEFHERSIDSMLAVADEIRIFPILDLNSNRSKYLDRIVERYRSMNYVVEERVVDYEFQIGGNRMLQIYKNKGNSFA